MPVRTYSPSASGGALSSFGSKYTANITSSPLSVGNYKPLSGHSPTSPLRSTVSNDSSKLSAGYASGSSLGSASIRRYSGLSSSSYSPSSSGSLHTGSYSSLSSTTSSSSSSSSSSSISSYNNHSNQTDYSAGHYIPRGSFNSSRFSANSLASSASSSPVTRSALGASATTRYSAPTSVIDVVEPAGYSHRTPLGATRSSHYTPTSSASRYSATLAGRRPSYTNSNSGSFTDRISSSTTGCIAEQLPSEVPKGLVNLGNTCYMNASIQSLYAIETFRNFILRSSHDKTLTSELADLFKTMKNSSAYVSPANFKYAFSRYQQKFSGFGQQDAQEFLRYLINGVHEEFNSASSRPRRAAPPRPPKSAQEAWSQYTDIVDDSPLVNIVVGQMCSTIVCTECQNKSSCWDPFWDLSLPLMRGRRPVRLTELVQDFTAKETLDSDERPVCSSCKKATKSTKQINLCRLPKLLILHLKKFTNDGYKLTSADVTVDKTLTFEGTSYHLTACISHHGHSSSSGHYTSHCEYSNRWYHFDDDRVRDVTSRFDSSKLDDAYVLFYVQSSSSRGSISQSKL